ncbi:TPA: AAA family ATPase [Burkholderia vietnamiensis]|nr:AAA family ATPase [Burkholderia vietnamiensis]HDR8975898.1 AAA family ATPase [Burkholderia vietnamiensis]HDR9066203.1 AAA family ATPase [Burkholderia vietnamiensis]
MANELDAKSARGSVWHRWDPHIHVPGTALNDQYGGTDPWEGFLKAVDAAAPPLRAVGITDYFGIDGYVQALEYKKLGRLPNVDFIFPNVELRLSIETSKASAINLHLLFCPDDADHVDRIHRFLRELQFSYQGETFRCERTDLIRLGRVHNPRLTDDGAARTEGANQFKVTLDHLKEAVHKSEWARKNLLFAVAGGEKDGTSGLRDESASFAALRKEIERTAHIIFSGNPKQTKFWLGKEALSVEDLQRQYNGPKPCLHGSDAHSANKVGVPDIKRLCWIKGDLTFETLRQVCIEPGERVFIGEEPPKGALNGSTIESISVSSAPWLSRSNIELNAGLVAIIGARGSGKTALADLIAAAGHSLPPWSNEKSFLSRARPFLGGSEARLHWTSGEETHSPLISTDPGELLDRPHVQYMSQQFVDQLCSADGPNDELVDEIERVIFNAHPYPDRFGADTFEELLNIRLEASRDKRSRNQQALVRASADLTEERVRKDGLKALEKDRDDRQAAIEKDKKDRNSLVGKGNEARARRLEQISEAVDRKRQRVDLANRKLRALQLLKQDIADFRTLEVEEHLEALKQRREESELTEQDWSLFKLVFAGDVDALLETRISEAKRGLAAIQGAPVEPDPNADPTIALIADDAVLGDQTLALMEREFSRLQALVGIDVQNSKRYTTLSEKITKAESALKKVLQQIERAKTSDAKIKELVEARRTAYAEVFAAIVEEDAELSSLYAPIKERIEQSAGSLSKLSFSVRRAVDLGEWAAKGESLLDLRKTGPFRGRGELLKRAEEKLLTAWSTGDAATAAATLFEFVKENEADLRTHIPDGEDFRAWARAVSDWLYSTEHISVGYGLQYDGVDIEQLSPGTRGIVLLLLYLAIDAEDDRPLIIDQPEENLDPQSIFQELVDRFREAKKRRQIIIVTHNANLVVNTDAEQVIVATCGPHRPSQLPEISYNSGSLENPHIRKHVCDILEGGERAFKERAKRLRVAI